MPRIEFDSLPTHGRLWVFPLSRSLTSTERDTTMGVVDRFLDGWAAHGSPLRSARRIEEDRFLLIGVDVDAEAPSGCSIDALVRSLRDLGESLGVSFVDHAPVWYRADDGIRSVSRVQFRELASTGDVTPDTTVFDTSLTSVDQVNEGRLERPAHDSWHGAAFFRQAV